MDTTVLQRTTRTEGMRGNMATAAMGLGGVLALVGSFLTWASVSLAGPLARAQGPLARSRRKGSGTSLGVSGLDTTAGRAVLALSIALIVVAVLAFVAYWFWLRLGAVVVGLVLGAIALVWSALDLASPSSAFGLIGLRGADVGTFTER